MTTENTELPLSYAILLFIIPFILILLKLAGRSTKLPPGPRKLPLIGNLHQLAQGLPHRVLRDLSKKYGPILHLKIGEVSTIVVSTPEMAELVMKTHDTVFASRPAVTTIKALSYDFKGISFTPYGEYWRQMRKICIVELLNVKRVQSFHSIREEEWSSLVRWITSKESSTINLTEKILLTSFDVLTRAIVGKVGENRDSLLSTVSGGIELAAGFNVGDVFPSMKFLHYICGLNHKLKRLASQSDTVLENIIEEHITRKSSTVKDQQEIDEDLVDILLKYHEKESGFSLTTDHIKCIILDLFAAGGETSTTTVVWAMCEMLKNPDLLKKAQDEVRRVFSENGFVDEEDFQKLKYMKAVIRETLRLHAPVPLLLPRESMEECEIKGYTIPVKTKVLVNVWAIGRDPKYWEDSECFKPERFLDSSIDFKGTNFDYLPFGAGRRICPGMSFGLANVELPLAKFLYHFDWNLPNGMKHEELDVEAEAFGVTARRKEDLYVIPTVYKL